ncbi:response regulator [Legionella fairfieldensis]|uniref:response regulator n=1 Tax=Legionella fairfieldensis TaxID=45064 RepID=UPI00048B2684|nr:response regulator [Legionella fairfieldensis]
MHHKSNDKKNRILIVEDNYIAQTVAQSILTQFKCDVDIADCGKKAIELWKSKTYDLIFMDIGLPDMDGYEVTRFIRGQELTTKTHMPIIALTAHTGDENKKRCLEAGMNAILTKPLTIRDCADIIDTFIPAQPRGIPDRQYTELPKQKEQLFNLSDFPLLDVEEGIKTTGNETIFREMLRLMVNESIISDRIEMKEAHDNQDWDKTQKIAHKIKGGAVYVGTTRLKMACQYLERYWKTGQRDLLEPLYQQILTVIEKSLHEIKDWLNTKS